MDAIEEEDHQGESDANDIWSRSLALLEKIEPLERRYIHGYSTILITGSHFGGKSSIVERFIATCATGSKRSTEYEETIALEYSYAKQEPSELGKLCNIWELGYGLLFINLAQFALQREMLRSTSLVIVVDLTRPEEMLSLLEGILEQIAAQVNHTIDKDNTLAQSLVEQATKRASFYQEDQSEFQNTGKAFPLPVMVIGSKYDEFQNVDPEKKKQIVRYLRAECLHVGAQLVFVSSKSESLTKRVNAALQSLAFEPLDYSSGSGTGVKPSVSTQHTKPVMLPFGYDTWSKIGVSSLTEARSNFLTLFPQSPMEELYQPTIGTDPRVDHNFAEPEIDQMLEYKYMMLKSEN